MKQYYYELILRETDENGKAGNSECIPILPITHPQNNDSFEHWKSTQVDCIGNTKFSIMALSEQLQIEHIQYPKILSRFNIPESELFNLIQILLQFNLERIHNKEKLKK